MATKEPQDEKIQESFSLSEEDEKPPDASDKNKQKQSPKESQEIEKKQTELHENLSKCVKSFSYWANNIKEYISMKKKLDKLTKELDETVSPNKILSDEIKKFNKNNKKQSPVYKRFFKEFSQMKENPDEELCLEDFNGITDKIILDITDILEKSDLIKTEKGTSSNTSEQVFIRTFENRIKRLKELIEEYRETKKVDNLPEKEKELNKKKLKERKKKEKEIEEIKKKILKVESLEDNTLSNTKTKDTTNFVAAEMGFLIEVQDKDNVKSDIEYYSYPVKLKNKNTFNIYDLQDQKHNYFFVKNKNLSHGNTDVDDFLKKHKIGKDEKRCYPLNDYHSESTLFFLCQDNSFQNQMVNKLKKDLEKKQYKVTKFEKLILEIHSRKYICCQCFPKAKYLLSWNENQEEHFLKGFKVAFSKRLKNHIDPNSVLDFKVEIRISYDETNSKTSQKTHPYIIMLKNDGKNLSCRYHTELSNYSIIISGGVANANRNYSYAHNMAAQEQKHRDK